MQFYLLQILPSRLPLGRPWGMWECGRRGDTCGSKCFSNSFYFSLLVVIPPLFSSPEMLRVVNSHAFSWFWRGNGWFSVFSTATLDFNFLRFSKSVTIHLLSSVQTFVFVSFPEEIFKNNIWTKSVMYFLDPFISLISKFLVYVILVALLMNLCFGAEVPVAISNAYSGQAGVLAPLTGPKP